MKHTWGLMLLSFCVLACSDSQAPHMTPQLSIVAGDAQSDTVGKTLTTQVSAKLTDKTSGLPLSGHIVNWLTPDGGGVFAPVSQTGADGVAKQTWTLGGVAGPQTLVARWLDPATGEPVTVDTAHAIAVPGVAVTLEANFGPNTNPQGGNVWAVGDTVLVEYRFFDAHRNPTTSCADGGSIDRITWTSSNAAAIKPLNTVRLIGTKRYAEFLALATSPDPVVLTADPADVCSAAATFGVSGWVR